MKRTLSSANSNSLLTIRLVLVLDFNCDTLNRLAFPPSLDVYSFCDVFEGHFQHRCQVDREKCRRQYATLLHAIGVAHSDTGLHTIVKGRNYVYKLIGAAILLENRAQASTGHSVKGFGEVDEHHV